MKHMTVWSALNWTQKLMYAPDAYLVAQCGTGKEKIICKKCKKRKVLIVNY